MAALVDIKALLIGAAVLALLGWDFAHVFTRFRDGLRQLAHWSDGRAARQRAAIGAGPVPLWLRGVRAFLITTLIALGALLFLRKAGFSISGL